MKKTPSKPCTANAGSASLRAIKARMKKRLNDGEDSCGDVTEVKAPPDVVGQSVVAAKATGLWGRTALATGQAVDESAAEGVQEDPMVAHRCIWDPAHIESPLRLERARQRCQELGLDQRCVVIPARVAGDDELLSVHDQSYLDHLKSVTSSSEEVMKKECLGRDDDPSFFISKDTLEAARTAAAAVLDLATAVATGKDNIRNGLALVRPPGHHAGKSEPNGFCFFNNVALAARKLLDQDLAKKVMIVDFDIHHGQATQREFFEDQRVLYTSIHRYEHGRFWPHLRESDFDYVGAGGTNVNLPVNEIGLGDQDYLAFFHQIVLPVGHAFSPDVVLVSAGFDGALGCPEGHMRLSPAIYGHLIHNLCSLASGRVAAVMEGRYFLLLRQLTT